VNKDFRRLETDFTRVKAKATRRGRVASIRTGGGASLGRQLPGNNGPTADGPGSNRPSL